MVDPPRTAPTTTDSATVDPATVDPATIDPADIFHWALVVADFDVAAARIEVDLGYTFAESIESNRPYVDAATGAPAGARLRVAYSRQGPPYLELIEILTPGGFFTEADIGTIHHIGLWADDIDRTERELLAAGRGDGRYRSIDPDGGLFAIVTAPRPYLGGRIEYVSSRGRPRIEHWASTGRLP